MNSVKYGMSNFLAALRPGLESLVMSSFKSKLSEKMDKVVEEVYADMAKELPDVIKSRIESVMLPEFRESKVHVEIDLRGCEKE